VVRSAVIYGAVSGAMGVVVLLALYHIAMGELGYMVMLIVSGVIFALFAYQAQQFLRDLNAEPIVLEGEVLKKWHKGNFLIFLMPSFYVYVAEKIDDSEERDDRGWGKIFTIKRTEYARLLETDLLRVTCYPHSLTVHQLEMYDDVQKKYVPADGGEDY
jgi:hypothetical protein